MAPPARQLSAHNLDKSKLSFSGRASHDHAPEPIIAQSTRATGNTKPQIWASLHHHSTFSYLDGFALPEAHHRRAAEMQIPAIAMTEHGNVSSHVRHEKAAADSGVKAIFGVELYCGHVDDRRQQLKNHLTVIAANPTGYRNMLQLVTRTFAEGYYYEPTASGDMLRDHKAGLIILSGCQGSLLFTTLMGGKGIDVGSYKAAKAVAAAFKATFGPSYYIELQAFPELERAREANPQLARIARELGIPLVATLDCHYTTYDEREMQMILHNVRGGGRKTLEEQAREWGYDVALCPLSDRTIYRRLRATGLDHDDAVRSINNAGEIAAGINFSLPKLPTLRYPCSDPIAEWRKELLKGWEFRGCDRLAPAVRSRYRKQLQYEMKIIEDKDFCDYFLMVGDAVRWAKDHGIVVGPARGSAAASVACWLLRITEIDPMRFPNLVFERFIDVTRADLPDIDLDFDSDRRWEVREYLVRKYGAESVGNIGTFSTYKAKLSLDDVARVHKIPRWEVDTVKDYLIERSSGDLRASATIEDTVDQFDIAKDVFDRHPALRKATQLEGNVKGFGVHSAGLVVANGPITDVCAVHRRIVNGRTIEVISLDKYDAERQGFVKMDFLGLSTMAMIAEAMRHTGVTLDSLYAMEFDDENVIDLFRRNDVTGIFQFSGTTVRNVNGSLKPDNFAEICDICALGRPGPLHNGAVDEYISVKRGTKAPELIHPALEQIVKGTKYQIVYQEQILRIVREIGDFDWTHASYIRKIISQKIGEQEFNRQWDRFRDGAATLHKRSDYPAMDERTAKAIWGTLITSGSYAFNAAHSTAYGMLAYWTAWFKVYHPEAYYASGLTKLPESHRAPLLRDAARGAPDALIPRPKIFASAPEPSRPSIGWAPGERTIQSGIEEIPGLGEKTAQALIDYHASGAKIKEWKDYLPVKGIGKVTIAKVEEFCAKDDPFDVYKLDRAIERATEFIAGSPLPRPTHRSVDIPYEGGRDVPVCWIGTITKRNLRDIFEVNRRRGEELDPESVKEPELNEFVLMYGTDGEESVLIRVDRWKYPAYKASIWGLVENHDLLLVQGVKKSYRTAREILVQRLWVIDPE